MVAGRSSALGGPRVWKLIEGRLAAFGGIVDLDGNGDQRQAQ